MATCDDDQVLQLRKEERQTKSYGDQSKSINRDFVLVIKAL
jgi:hypothetical protein